ncbi:hypothetical protein [Winogradskyella bathintestinalis]|uniref:DUF748 domain-containing protein n=1 Tax=Winogradskyella bathintestinalis TaxID=3035208 RepID=A0ABT7ZW00_9FLAO|nr:hypothetical protein [Winogradskyella bathintestinalis]MDN3493154.1 hypothetical protein [Winogradskyella bathintestinalis]
MNKKYKKIGVIIAIVLTVILITTFVVNIVIENKITTAIEKLPKSVKIKYESVDANIWTGNLEMIAPKVMVIGETTQKTILDATLNTIEINEISYWNFLMNDKISVETLIVNQLVAKYKHNPVVKNDDYKSGFLENINQIINIEKININNADILITNYNTDSTILSIPKLNFELKDIKINPEASITKNKFNYSDFNLAAKNLQWATNEYDKLYADSVHVTNDKLSLKHFKLKTKYNTTEYSKILKTERDHFNVQVKEVIFSNMDFGFNTAEEFYFKSKEVLFNSPETEIYRDKLVADDTTYKPLYGKMLRDLNFKLGVDTLKIADGKISYLEKVKSDKPAGRLDFLDMNATISNLGNTFGNDETRIKVNTMFMDNSPVEVNWNFKVADTTDQFVFKADLGVFNALHMDQFTQPNLNVDLNGELEQTYFTISGNPSTSHIDLKMKYDDFEVSILKKDGEEKNKFLSTIANLFVSKDSQDDKKEFRYGQAESVERDVTKSVFNYVWLNIKAGLLSAMTGDGEQDN